MQSIAKKVLVALLLVNLVVLSTVAFWTMSIQTSDENERYDNTKADVVKQLQVILQDPVFSYDFPLIQSIIDAYMPDPIIAQVKVTDHRDKDMAETKLKQDIELDGQAKWYDIKSGDGELIGKVKIAFSRSSVDDRLSSQWNQKWFSMIISMIVLSVLLVFLIKKVVIEPLTQVSDVLRDIAAGGGDLTQRIPVKTNDEIGTLATNFNSFIQKIQEIITDVAQGASGLGGLSSAISDVCHKTTMNTHEQKEQTEHSLNYLKQLSEATGEIAQNAELTASSTTEAFDMAAQSRTDVETNLEHVQQLVDELENNAKVASELKSASENIGGVLDVIKGIAEQTNLLALNAAIEAARAGETGRGFAVVADEVRSLASKTRQSTEEIESIIASLQSKADDSYKASHRSKDLVSETIESTQKTVDSFGSISDKMSGINDMIIQIASATEEQSLLTKEVSQGIEHLLDGATRLAQETKELEHSTQSMIEVEQQLSLQIKQFKY
ncbi:methyl-accepting chemotaxis sensory transducer [Catenovulum agarivorans DS-2]|uniref:Methyl-accepting chemotaxis sensory transducer n=1 Tax=Catenovulum agarivorans DS-2 TaxID=1328313 RepID=W7QS28_9ALTE|nr:methyl-accepting chemotaxis protein [Catenovulum agarivorans]EWH08205.1 methyl-accepting chemotaxis sensory transducer [Catenovulum agarivorans DS-2]